MLVQQLLVLRGEKMELKGKKIAILGDSITQGVGASSELTRYTNVFADMTGADVYNYGISGTRFARQSKPSENPKFDLNFLDRVDGMVEDADIVVVFGGTNDFGHGDAAFGSFADTDEYTFYGATHSLCKRLINRYPNATVIFMLPLHRTSEERYVDGRYKRLVDYVNAISEVCAYYSIPVLDLYRTSGLQPEVEIIKSIYMPDGLHPSDAGAKRIAERLAGFLTAL